MNEETLFNEALAKSDPQERALFLDRACAGEPEFRAAVEALLAAHESSGGCLDQAAAPRETTHMPTPGGPSPLPTNGERPTMDSGAVIAGRYTLVQRLGEGGMGEVWVAKQTEPVKRMVALKLIKPGMDSKAVLARFEQERQALALMDHPHIAKVLDGGLTDDHRPFFVMELVNGQPLTKFCDDATLTPRQRLELFVPICQAVQHAHQKGIVHRDLKPSNILVTLYDGKPVPKVIDFGVAKATGGKLTDESLSTQFGAVVGTLEYMSPEQAGFSGHDIDTRADIYSLGVVLYELLTGLRPFDTQRLRQAALDEIIRVIREEEPSKPSTRLSTNDGLPSLAALRQTEPRQLMAMLRGELDWVVMKCLEKDRGRRYETASDLARDLGRYLADEPVEARPASAGYRLRKFVRRHRGPVLAAVLVLFVLVGGIVGTSIGLLQAESARQDEVEQRGIAQQKERLATASAEQERLAKIAAQVAQNTAEKRQGQLQTANEFMASVFRNWKPADTRTPSVRTEVLLSQRLTKAAELLQGEAVGDPLAVSEQLSFVGNALVVLEPARVAETAIPLLMKVHKTRAEILGPKDPRTLRALSDLGHAYYHLRKTADIYYGIGLLREALAMQRARLGAGHVDADTLKTTHDLAEAFLRVFRPDRAIPLYEEFIAQQKAQGRNDHLDTMEAMHTLAFAYHRMQAWNKAIPLCEECLRRQKARDPDSFLTYQYALDLAAKYVGAFQRSKALALLPWLEKHRDSGIRVKELLASCYQMNRQPNQAIPYFEEALAFQKKSLGVNHAQTKSQMYGLAAAFLLSGQRDKAVQLIKQADGRFPSVRDDADAAALLIVLAARLGSVSASEGNFGQAVMMFEEAIALQKAQHGPDHAEIWSAMSNLAEMYVRRGYYDKGRTLLEEVLERKRTKFPPAHYEIASTMSRLSQLQLHAGRTDQAILTLEEVLQKGSVSSEYVQVALADAYLKAGRFAKAIAPAEAAFASVDSRRQDSLRFVAMLKLAESYFRCGRLSDAEPLLAEWIASHRPKLLNKLPLAAPLNRLAACKLAAKDDAEAEQLLREAQTICTEFMGTTSVFEQSRVDALRYDTESLLGAVLADQKKDAEAESLLIDSAKALLDEAPFLVRANRDLPVAALNRLIDFYDARGKKNDADKWRAQLEVHRQAQKKSKGTGS